MFSPSALEDGTIVGEATLQSGKTVRDLNAWWGTDAGLNVASCYHVVITYPIEPQAGRVVTFRAPRKVTRSDAARLRGLLRASGLFSSVRPK